MPRVYLTDNDQQRQRLARWVYGEMKVRRITLSALAKKRGISHQALSKKLSTPSFDYIDFVFFVKEFQPSDRELREIIGV
jgi:hypothetical protein